ncbi:MAG TPA: MBL fold metallo-hydrolase [Acidimicrobiia bacterium]|nr:MBL fold metallo-hydrolase [Acidimicrobiia bacterium]
MRVLLRGVRGSVPSPGAETVGYGGNTSCLEVRATPGCLTVLDAGTGIRAIDTKPGELHRVDVLLTHLHMDHILGLGFFRPLYEAGLEIHVWGPPSEKRSLRRRLTRYLSPPLFPVRLQEMPSRLELHDAPPVFRIPGLSVATALVCHPGATLGYRLEGERGGALTYIPDHEPARDGGRGSGDGLARGADVLVHDAQFTDEEYPAHAGWGHSSVSQALAFAERAGVARFVPFHHAPDHGDAALDAIWAAAAPGAPFAVIPAREGMELVV